MKNFHLTLALLLLSFAAFAQVDAITGPTNVCEGSNITLASTTMGGSWYSLATGTATVDIVTGIVTGVAAGTAVISYDVPGTGFAIATVTVDATPAISGPTTVCEGATMTLAGTIPGGTWSSNNLPIATVGSASGIVSGVTVGTATIEYVLASGCLASFPIIVNTAPATFNVTGGGALCAGGAGLYINLDGSTPGVDYQLNRLGSPVDTIAGTGGAMSFGPDTIAGIYTVVATLISTGCVVTMSGGATIVVNPLPSTITTSTSFSVCSGSTLSLTSLPSSGTWTSSFTPVATVDATTGVVTGGSPGTATITYTLPTTCSVSTTVTVNLQPAPISGASGVCSGSTTALFTSTSGGTWSSSNPAVATVGSVTGLATGVATGAVTITYAMPTGCLVTTNVTVNLAPTPVTGGTTICTGSANVLGSTPAGGTWTSSNISVAVVGTTGMVTGMSTGTAMITYTLSSGCFQTDTVTIITSPAAIAGPSSVCYLGTMTLSNSTAGGVWGSSNPAVGSIDGTGLVAGVALGAVTITYNVSAGCFVIAPITVDPLPAPITGYGNACVGYTVLMSSTTPGGSWSSSGTYASINASTGIATGIAAGVETITYALPTGCITSRTLTVNTTPCGPLTVTEFAGTSKVTLFPNPASDEVTIKMDNSAYSSFTVTNSIGQVLMEQKLHATETSVRVSNLPPAMYYITFRGDHGTTVKRFLKQ